MQRGGRTPGRRAVNTYIGVQDGVFPWGFSNEAAIQRIHVPSTALETSPLSSLYSSLSPFPYSSFSSVPLLHFFLFLFIIFRVFFVFFLNFVPGPATFATAFLRLLVFFVHTHVRENLMSYMRCTRALQRIGGWTSISVGIGC